MPRALRNHRVSGSRLEGMSAPETPANSDASDDTHPDSNAEVPAEVHRDYANEPVQIALRELQQTPDYAHLAAFLNSLREGYLVVDVTGTGAKKKKGPRVRTIRSTRGQLVLPLFTSMDELRALAPANRREEVKGAVMPALDALALIAADRFVAAEFDKASAALVVLRKYIVLARGGEPITAASLETMK